MAENYTKRLFVFLNKLLPSILGDTDRVRRMVNDPENKEIWEKTFTHFTYSAENNYERLEFLGDTICKPAFCMYLIESYDQDFSERELTELTNVYMAKVEQANYSIKLGLTKFLRVDRNNESELFRLYTDIFEAFVGAVHETGDNLKKGLGFLACRKLINYLFDDDGLGIEIHLKYGEGSGKTVIYQILQRLGIGKPIEEQDYIGGEYVTKIYLTQDQVDEIASPLYSEDMGILLTKRKGRILIGEGSGNTQKVADYQAFTDAYYGNLREKGVTVNWANKVKSNKDLSKGSVAKYKEQVLKAMKKQNMEDIQFNIPSKLSNKKATFIQLIAIRRGNQVILESTTVRKGDSYEDAKEDLIKKYLGY